MFPYTKISICIFKMKLLKKPPFYFEPLDFFDLNFFPQYIQALNYYLKNLSLNLMAKISIRTFQLRILIATNMGINMFFLPLILPIKVWVVISSPFIDKSELIPYENFYERYYIFWLIFISTFLNFFF